MCKCSGLGTHIGDTSSWRCEICASRAADVQGGYHKMKFACMPYGMYLLCLCHPLCFNLQHGYCQAAHQVRTQQKEKYWAEQQDLVEISATHRHEDARCVPVELLVCKVVITKSSLKCSLPACAMECTYSACVTLFASICSTRIVKLLIRCARNKKNTEQSNRTWDRYRRHIVVKMQDVCQ